jgi:YegS/Rv2252/BmrU family lipid kinase
MSETCVFLVNPASANGSTGRRWPEIARAAAAAGLQGATLFSERPGHLGELARAAAGDGADLLVVVGGDGSVNEVANGLVGLEQQPTVAIVPRGTGWDFVRTFGIPRQIEAAAEIALRGETRSIDLGRVTYRAWSGAGETAVFANVASAGMSGAIAQRANETTKALGGKASYLLATVRVFSRWKPSDVHVRVDGEVRSGPMLDVVVANGRYFGGGMRMCPDAEPDDGLFDVLTIGDVSKADFMRTMPKIYRGTHLPHPKAELLRGATVEIEAETPVPIELDGEQPGTTPARFEILRDAFRLRCPAS